MKELVEVIQNLTHLQTQYYIKYQLAMVQLCVIQNKHLIIRSKTTLISKRIMRVMLTIVAGLDFAHYFGRSFDYHSIVSHQKKCSLHTIECSYTHMMDTLYHRTIYTYTKVGVSI